MDNEKFKKAKELNQRISVLGSVLNKAKSIYNNNHSVIFGIAVSDNPNTTGYLNAFNNEDELNIILAKATIAYCNEELPKLQKEFDEL